MNLTLIKTRCEELDNLASFVHTIFLLVTEKIRYMKQNETTYKKICLNKNALNKYQ